MIRTFSLVLAATALLAGTAMPGPARAASSRSPTTDTPAPSGVVRLMAVGDVVLGQTIGRRIIRNGPDTPWSKVSTYLNQADLLSINLECPISSRGTPWAGKKYTLRAPPGAAGALVAAGVDVANLANNHTLDYGVTAFGDTLATLDSLGVAHTGGGLDTAAAHAPVILERNGLRIGFLGYALYFAPGTKSLWTAGANKAGVVAATPTLVAQEVAALKARVDVVVVNFHGGRTNGTRPTTQVRQFTRAAVGAGAALVIGHHPHVLQGYTSHGNSLVAYSLGNFVFDFMTGRQLDSAILDVTLSADGVTSFSWIPVVIERGLPRPAAGAEINRILAQIRPLQP